MRAKGLILLACSIVTLGSVAIDQSEIFALQSAPSTPGSGQAAKEPKQTGDVTFTPGGMGEISFDNGIRLGFTDYTASDGAWLRVLYLTEHGEAQAVTAFHQRLAHAAKVISRSEKKDAKGRVVGERAEVLAPAAPPNPPFHAVIWTDGPTFHEIESSSLRHALQFERLYRH
jgi:hypothetical protein